jgi:hypothetical protein
MQAASLQPGLIAPQLSSLRTSCLGFLSRIRKLRKVLFTAEAEPGLVEGKEAKFDQD